MGYTNYWTQYKPFTKKEWDAIKKEYDYIKENFNDVIIKDESENADEIIFNGLKENENDHETFYISRLFRKSWYSGDNVKFNFCKTARKPYDLAVWHMLTFIKIVAPNSIDISRDGWSYEKMEGKKNAAA